MDVGQHLDEIKKWAGSSYAFEQVTVEIEQDGSISVAEDKQFLFGCSWMKRDPFPSVMVVRKKGKLEVKGNFKIFSGAKVFVNQDASLVLGSGYINSNLNLHCFKQIEIGDDVAIADNVTIRDSDNHFLLNNGNHEVTKPIRIGNHVWIGMNVTILKGVTIGDGAVVAAGAVVTRDIPEKCLAAGVPAKVIKENVVWE
jgi:acetyltransferase-like isoleucine patch superfamily enzyme